MIYTDMSLMKCIIMRRFYDKPLHFESFKTTRKVETTSSIFNKMVFNLVTKVIEKLKNETTGSQYQSR